MPIDHEATKSSPALTHGVRSYNQQNEGMALVAGWQVEAQVTAPNGRKFVPVLIAVCPQRDDAEEIAAMLNAKYGGEDA